MGATSAGSGPPNAPIKRMGETGAAPGAQLLTSQRLEGRTTDTFVTPDDYASEPDATVAAEQLIRNSSVKPGPIGSPRNSVRHGL